MAKIPVMVRLEGPEAAQLREAADAAGRSQSYLARVFVVDGLTRLRVRSTPTAGGRAHREERFDVPAPGGGAQFGSQFVGDPDGEA